MTQRKQIDIFIEGVKRYFDHFSDQSDSLEIGTPYLVRNSEPLGMDYTGVITVSGANQGYVFFSATRSLLKYILLSLGESCFSEQFMSDLVGEVANTISGNARSSLGSEFYISTPNVIIGQVATQKISLDDRSYVLPLRWKTNAAQLVVSLEF
jgi:chemotaxis protein CheX